MTEVGLPVMPSTAFADCPTSLDVLFVPGGLDGSVMMMEDQEVIEFLADRRKTARDVTSDCTGALVLGAAGLGPVPGDFGGARKGRANRDEIQKLKLAT